MAVTISCAWRRGRLSAAPKSGTSRSASRSGCANEAPSRAQLCTQRLGRVFMTPLFLRSQGMRRGTLGGAHAERRCGGDFQLVLLRLLLFARAAFLTLGHLCLLFGSTRAAM